MPDAHTTITLGIVFGLIAALFQAGSYIFSRRFLTECQAGSTVLFAVSHMQMGVAAAILLPFLLRGPLPPFSNFALQLLATSGFYLAAQWLLLIALKTTNSSVVAPLLGLKIPILGLIGVCLLGQEITLSGWLAIGLCAIAAFLVSPPVGLPACRTLSLILLVCLGYCGSDIFIPRLVARLEGTASNPVLLGVALTYVVCGLVGLAVAIAKRALAGTRIQCLALPYSTCWFVGMCFLFATFARVGVIFGNMLQATRSLVAVLLGLWVVRLGFTHIETASTRGTWVLRVLGAALMTIGIVLYYARMV